MFRVSILACVTMVWLVPHVAGAQVYYPPPGSPPYYGAPPYPPRHSPPRGYYPPPTYVPPPVYSPPRGYYPPGYYRPRQPMCRDGAAYFAVGARYTPQMAEQARRAAGARMVRLIRPGMSYTMEFRGDRLNLEVNRAGWVTRVRCG